MLARPIVDVTSEGTATAAPRTDATRARRAAAGHVLP
jgi:hypothetical protein